MGDVQAVERGIHIGAYTGTPVSVGADTQSQTWKFAVAVFSEERMLFAVTPEGKVSMPDDITADEMLTAMRLMKENRQR